MNSAAFDEFGRMTANLGLEAVPATPAGQNILLYPYIAPSTEVIDGTNLPKGDVNVTPISSGTDGTQIWKITHNGVDTHPIHFHLYNVQLLNRVTWDNIIIPTEPSELGWKETIRVSPLEDTIVAIRPIVPTLPFEVPNSIRPLSPMMPLGADLDPNGIIVDPNGNITTLNNALVNFGWEYVYHCHILSHEEMDMMRPVLLAVPPLKADMLAFDQPTKTLSWNDNSITETSFVVQTSASTARHGRTSVRPSTRRSTSRTSIRRAAWLIRRSTRVSRPTIESSPSTWSVRPTRRRPGIRARVFSAPLLVGLLTTTTLTSDVNLSLDGQTVLGRRTAPVQLDRSRRRGPAPMRQASRRTRPAR